MKNQSRYCVTIRATFANKDTETFLITVTAPGRESARDVARYESLPSHPGIVSQTVLDIELLKPSQN